MRKAIVKVLRRDWGHDNPSYTKLIATAKKHGIRILAINRTVPESLEDIRYQTDEFVDADSMQEGQWSRIVSDQVRKDPTSRILMLTGKFHVRIDPTDKRRLTSFLDLNKLNPLVIDLTASAHKEERGNPFPEACYKAGLLGERFAVPVLQSTSQQADFIVNIPPRLTEKRVLRRTPKSDPALRSLITKLRQHTF